MTTFITKKTFKNILIILFFFLLGSFIGLGFVALHDLIDSDTVEISASSKSKQPIEDTYYQVEVTFSDNIVDTIVLKDNQSLICPINGFRVINHNIIKK